MESVNNVETRYIIGDEIVIDQVSGNIMHEYCKDEYVDDFIDSNFIEKIAEEEE